ncbi:MAG: hypothetical protein ABSE20_26750 [Acetobacteraceae bacterium]|jgi:hypothetical protein
MVRWCALAVVAIAGVMAGAKAQDRGPPGIVFDGTARTGTDTRPVRFRFFCSSNNGPNITGVLAVELEIPQYEQLSAVFDLEPFEGPDANAGPLTLLRAAGARSKASDRFAAAGSIIPSGVSEAFMLGVDASRRGPGPLRKLAAVLRPLTEGPAQLAWQQGNARPGGTPMTAGLDLSKAQSEQLKSGLGPCLGAR